MAITTYSELTTAISDRYARFDFTATHLAEFIALTETRMQRQLRALDMETKTADFALNDEYVAIPIDFLGIRDFYVTSGGCRATLELVAPEYISRHYDRGSTDLPSVYSIVGRQFRFGGSPAGASATLIYYAKIPPLTNSNVTNWVLRDHPDAYLYGSLTEAAIKLQDQEAATGYGNLFSQAVEGIQGMSRGIRATGPAMYARPG